MSGTRFTALNKRTISLDADVLLIEKLREKFGKDTSRVVRILDSALRFSVADVKETPKMIAKAKALVAENVERRKKHYAEYVAKHGHDESKVHRTGLLVPLPEDAEDALDDLRRKGVKI